MGKEVRDLATGKKVQFWLNEKDEKEKGTERKRTRRIKDDGVEEEEEKKKVEDGQGVTGNQQISCAFYLHFAISSSLFLIALILCLPRFLSSISTLRYFLEYLTRYRAWVRCSFA